jgi:hypothetical protein
MSVQVRALLSDYAVIIAILIFVVIDRHFALETPKLTVPTQFKVHFATITLHRAFVYQSQ